MVKVSIIVPVYNAEKYLASCIESALHQDYENIEVILVDDGSVDKSASICNSFSDERIRYMYKPNGGVSSARNQGVSMAEGQYLTFLDSDDLLPQDAIARLVESLEKTDSDIATGSFYYLYGEKAKPHISRLVPGEYCLELLLPGFIDDGTLSGFLLGSVCAVLYKTSIIKDNNLKFDVRVKNNEDGLFNFEYALHAKKLIVADEYVYYYRKYGDSSTSNRTQQYDYNKIIYDRINNLDWDKYNNKFDVQMQARNVSLALWDILLYPRALSFAEGVTYISERINNLSVREGVNHLSYNKLTRYKKVFAYLIRYRCSILLCVLIKFVYPVLNKRLKR